jgi:hypothetical protein
MIRAISIVALCVSLGWLAGWAFFHVLEATPPPVCPPAPPCVCAAVWPPPPTGCDLRLCVLGGWFVELPSGVTATWGDPR